MLNQLVMIEDVDEILSRDNKTLQEVTSNAADIMSQARYKKERYYKWIEKGYPKNMT